MAGWSGYSERGQGGEERGPSTFAFNAGNAPQTQASGGTTRLQAGQVKPRDTASVAIGPAKPSIDKTLEGIVQFADKAFGAQLEELRQEQFLKGMQQAASGEALTDIINEQPWFTRIFGPSGAASGARAYTVQAGVANWANQQERDMQELRKKSPDAIPEYLNKTVNAMKTGDTTTDVMMGMQIMKDAPTLMKVHARENYKYQQEQSVKARYAALDAAATGLQTAAGAEPGMYDQYDVESRTYNLYTTMDLKTGEDEASQQTAITAFVQSQALTGNFHVLNRLMADGVLKDLPLDTRLNLEKTVKAAQKGHAADAAEEVSTELALIQAGARNREFSGEEVEKKYDALNAEFTRKTGNTHQLIPKATRVGSVVSAIQAQARYEADAAKTIAQAESAADKVAAVRAAYNTTTTTSALIAHGVAPASAIDQMFYDDFLTRGDETAEGLAKRIPMLVKDAVGGRANPIIKEEMNQLLNSASPDTIDNNFVKGYAYWKSFGAHLVGGDTARGVYMTTEASKRYSMFDRHLAGRDLKEFGQFAYVSSQQSINSPPKEWKKADRDAVTNRIEATFNERAGTWFLNDNNLTKSSKAKVFTAISKDYSELMTGGLKPKEAYTEALARAKSQGLEQAGDFTWTRDPERPAILTYFHNLNLSTGATTARHVTQVELDEAFKRVVSKTTRRMIGEGTLFDNVVTGWSLGNVDDINVIRSDVGGKPSFAMLVTDISGKAHVADFDINTIEAQLLEDAQTGSKAYRDKTAASKGSGHVPSIH